MLNADALDFTEAEASFDETKIENQVKLSWLIPSAPCLKYKYVIVT